MKDFFEDLFLTVPYLGEVVFVVVGVVILFIFGLVSFETVLTWWAAAAFFVGLHLAIFFVSRLWKKWKDG